MYKKILLVEDVHAAHLLYKQALNQGAYEILSAERVNEAIKIVDKESIDLVVLDMELPDKPGMEFLKYIRNKKMNTPVIIVSAYGMKETILEAAKYKISYYLVKPVNLTMLRKRVKEILEKNEIKFQETKQEDSELSIIGDIKEIDKFNSDVDELKSQIQGLASKIIEVETSEEKNLKTKNLEEVVWNKDMICPLCGHFFVSYNYKSKTLHLKETETDFHEIYETVDPIIFDIIVCPSCYYAAKRNDFENLNEKQIKEVEKNKEERLKIGNGTDFEVMRDYKSAYVSFILAKLTYENLKVSNFLLGNLYHKAAWIARNMKDNEKENEALSIALQYYKEAYDKGDKLYQSFTENKLAYMIGELSYRLGKTGEAINYFQNLISNSMVRNTEKALYEMTKKQYEKIQEERKK